LAIFSKYRCGVMLASSALFIALAMIFSHNSSNVSDPSLDAQNSINQPIPPSANSFSSSSPEDVIGVWVPYLDLEILSNIDAERIFKEKFNQIIEKSKEFNANHIFIHVRSHCDALYPSKVFPWSHLLTGVQGKDPGFDPLEFMVETSHRNGLKFHAWINPLRVKSPSYPKKLCDKNPFYKLDADKHFLNHSEGTSLNPAFTETQDLILEGVREIALNYKIDGIHFDDYFYPEFKHLKSKDVAFENYLSSSEDEENKMDVLHWRKKNITGLLSRVYSEIKSINKNIIFGISPPGNPEECSAVGLDIPELCGKSAPLLDYICPQIYWSLDYKVMPFGKVAKTWKKMLKESSVKLYGGLALYKAGTDLDSGTWKNKKDVLTKELEIMKELKYQGVILYSWRYLNSSLEEILNLRSKLNDKDQA